MDPKDAALRWLERLPDDQVVLRTLSGDLTAGQARDMVQSPGPEARAVARALAMTLEQEAKARDRLPPR